MKSRALKNEMKEETTFVITEEDHEPSSKFLRLSSAVNLDENCSKSVADDGHMTENYLLTRNEVKSEEELDDDDVRLLSHEFSYVAKNGLRWATRRTRPRITAITASNAISNHFKCYSDLTGKINK